MKYPLSSELASRFLFTPATGSTNADLARYAKTDPANWPELSVLVTDFQEAGRGRLDRSWVATPGSSLMASILVRPRFSNPAGYGWLSILVGLAIAEAIETRLGRAVGMKWPNDILIGDKKVSGILAEALPDLSGVVIGFGINVNQSESELPFESATSLAAMGLEDCPTDELLASILEEFISSYKLLSSSSGEIAPTGLKDRTIGKSETLGKEVRVSFPDGTELLGLASDIDETGRLVIQSNEGTTSVTAGDVLHLRKL